MNKCIFITKRKSHFIGVIRYVLIRIYISTRFVRLEISSAFLSSQHFFPLNNSGIYVRNLKLFSNKSSRKAFHHN